jgi:dTDP-4-dehydrorhamnose 3,5-epimerase-like enzyme
MIKIPYCQSYKELPNLKIIEKEAWPFIVNRMFFIQDVRKLGVRGKHAHKSCWQFIFPLAGSIDIKIKNHTGESVVSVDSSANFGMVVPPMNWVEVRILRPKTVVAVMCSQEYDENDYIRDWKTYEDTVQQLRASTGGTAH